MRLRAVLAAVALVLTCAAVSEAQIRPPLPRRIVPRVQRFYVSANVGHQASDAFVETQTFSQYFEEGTFTLERSLKQPIFYDASVGYEVWRNLQVIGTFSLFINTGDGQLTASVPHPLMFDTPRSVSGDVRQIQRREMSYHIGAGWRVPVLRSLDFTVFGGPSIFLVDQVFATKLQVGLPMEVFPFDTLAFPSVDTESLTKTANGYHAGVDMTWRFARHFGAGLLVRYASATTEFTPPNGQAVEVKVGGLHAGGGLRVRF